MSGTQVDCVVNAGNVVGECPLWHPEHGVVYWTDINGFRIHSYHLVSGAVASWQFDEPVCTLSLTTDADTLLVALGSQVIFWKPASDQRTPFTRPEPNTPFNRLNDGATDPNGMFWVGSMRNNVDPAGAHIDVSGPSGSVFRVARDGGVTVHDTGYCITNTFVWSPDRTAFYCACSIAKEIYKYDYNIADSSIANRRVFASGLARGLPDGSAIDTEGFLWNARFFGGCIIRFAPDGTIDKIVEMPVSNITHCAFVGPNLDRMFVTTAALMAGPDERLAGGLFEFDPGVRGFETERFRL